MTSCAVSTRAMTVCLTRQAVSAVAGFAGRLFDRRARPPSLRDWLLAATGDQAEETQQDDGCAFESLVEVKGPRTVALTRRDFKPCHRTIRD